MRSNVYKQEFDHTVDGKLYCCQLLREFKGKDFVVEARFSVKTKDGKKREQIKYF